MIEILMMFGGGLLIYSGVKRGAVKLTSRGKKPSTINPPGQSGTATQFEPSSPVKADPVGDAAKEAASLNAREVQFLARTIWGEARGEPKLGQIAVAHVILNRVRARQWPGTVEEVVTQGNGSQFNVWRKADANYGRMLAVDESNREYQAALDVAEGAMLGRYPDPTSGDGYLYYNPETSTNQSFIKRAREQAYELLKIGNHEFPVGAK